MVNRGKLVACAGVAVLLLMGVARGQNQPLLVVGGDTTTASEFLYSYRKNRNVGSGRDSLTVRTFLKSYIVYRLKVADARRRGLDTLRKFREEFSLYRNTQLAQVLLDSADVEASYRAAYDRLQRDVDASHILVSVTAARSDSAALRRARELRAQLQEGAAFSELARRESDDPAASSAAGHLGYFSAFTMIAPFEAAAYATAVGDVSAPVRSQYGYHLIKVHGIRPSRGRMQVRHMLLRVPAGATDRQRDSVRAVAVRVRDAAVSGVPFDTLMKRYTPAAYAESAGGRYLWVRAGSVPPWFYDRVFSLEHDGDVSEPFESVLGWHIVKRVVHEAVPRYEESRELLRTLMRASGWSVDDDAAFVRAARRFVTAREELGAAVQLADWLSQSTVGERLPEAYEGLRVGEVDGVPLTVEEFYSWAQMHGVELHGASRATVLQMLSRCVDALSVERASERVSASDRRFAYLVREFHDGLLLFDVSGREVWNPELTSEETLQAYYKAHAKELYFDTCYVVEEYSAPSAENLERVDSLLRAGKRKWTVHRAMRRLGVMRREMHLGKDHPLMYGYGMSENEQERLLGRREPWRRGCMGPVRRKRGSKLYRVVDTLTRVPMSYEESKPLMRDLLQQEREQAWIARLRKEIPVEVDEEALAWVERQSGGR